MSLEIQGISKTFAGRDGEENIHVLENIQFRVEDGRFVSIVGPSGCGKTTLLRVMAGLEQASAGKVILDGSKLETGSKEIGMVFQEYALFPWRTTLQNIEIGPEIEGTNRQKRRLAAIEYIKMFDLEGFENRYPKELSGGMQQRVAIARTLIMNPRVVLMDEPFGSLDSQTRDGLQRFLLKIWEMKGETIIFVTHNVEEAVLLSDEILVFSRRPARIVRRLEIDVQRPRDPTSLECNAIRRDILKTLSKEMKRNEGTAAIQY